MFADIEDNDVSITSVLDVVAKRRRTLLQSQSPAVDIEYSVLAESSALMDVAMTLRSDRLIENLQREGLNSLISASTVVRTLLEPPPAPPATSMQPPPSTTALGPSSGLNETLAVSEENPKFTTARFLGLFAGAMSMLLLSIAYQYRKNIFQSIFKCAASSENSGRINLRKHRLGSDAQSAADEFIENACK